MPAKKRTKQNNKFSLVTWLRSYSIPLIFILGLVLVLGSLVWKTHEERILSFDTSSVPIGLYTSGPKPTRISIPKSSINVPVIESYIINGTWEINPHGASHLANSAVPNTKGNIIIYGHNLDNIFGRITKLQPGDTITVLTQNKKQYVYKIVKTETVDPSDVAILNPTSDETLTMYTCTGFADLKRFVVIAKRVSLPKSAV